MGKIGIQPTLHSLNEDFAGGGELHAIRAEIAEVLAHATPRARRPHMAPAGEAQRLDFARAGRARLIVVLRFQDTPCGDDFVQGMKDIKDKRSARRMVRIMKPRAGLAGGARQPGPISIISASLARRTRCAPGRDITPWM